jgi:hypothetical protein
MANDIRIEGVGTVHEFVEKAVYTNPSTPKPKPNGVGTAEAPVSFMELSAKAAAPQSHSRTADSPVPASE